MPPVERPLPMFPAEPPHEPLAYGRWAEALAAHFVEAARGASDEQPDEPVWHPDRTLGTRTFVPATARVPSGELSGYVSYVREHEGAQAADFEAQVYFTEDVADDNPDWRLDLSDLEIGDWLGPAGRRGKLTLVWGRALVANGAVATAELGPVTTDQCELVEDRFTLVTLDAYAGDLIEVRLFGPGGAELARESLYEDDDGEDG